MNIFYELENTSINISRIRKIGSVGEDAVRIAFDDGSMDIYHTQCGAAQAMKYLERTILQITPCPSPLYNVFNNNDGSYFHERVFCLALCADGIVRSLSGGGYFDLAEEASNFVGCFSEESLDEYPESVNHEGN